MTDAPPRSTSFSELTSLAAGLVRPGSTAVLGIAGAPGAGKTTLAVALVAALAAQPPPGCTAGWVVHVPMDGFHLADAELRRLGRLSRKGAPDTFDPAGYTALLQRIRGGGDEVVYAPGFDRDIEQPIAGTIAVPPATRLVVTEGNYLLHDDHGWHRVRDQLDAVWFCEVPDHLRTTRLVRRHEQFGKPPEAASAWVAAVDEPNAVLVAATANRADLLVGELDFPPDGPVL